MNQQQLQQKLQVLKPEYQSRFINEQCEFWNKTTFEGKVNEQMPRFRQFVFMHESPAMLNISFKYWKFCAFGSNETYNLNDIVTFLQAAQLRTLKDWINTYGKENPVENYEEFCSVVEELEGFVNPIIDEHADKLLNKLMQTHNLNVAAHQNIPLPAHRK